MRSLRPAKTDFPKHDQTGKSTRRLHGLIVRFIAAAITTLCAVIAPAQVSGGGVRSYGTVYYEESAASQAGIKQISAKAEIIAAVRTDGTIAAWGQNSSTSNFIPMPRGAFKVDSVAAGRVHVLAKKSDGTLFAWGVNTDGEATIPAGLGIVSGMAAGAAHSLAIRSNGNVAAWGNNDTGQCSVPDGLTNVIQVAAGNFHSVALRSDGTVVCWGDNQFGQCDVPAGLSGVVAVDANYYNTTVLKSDGTVVCWGLEIAGETKVPAGLSGVVQISCGPTGSQALKSDGTVVAWGQNTTFPAFTGAKQVAASDSNLLVLQADGRLRVSGVRVPDLHNVQTIFRNGTAPVTRSIDGRTAFLEAGSANPTATTAAASNAKTYAVGTGATHGSIRQDGTVAIWGTNNQFISTVPTGLTGVTQLRLGTSHALALKADGTLTTWGRNNNGQLNIPASASANVVEIGTGTNHSTALLSNGTVVCWGSNSSGQTSVPAGLSGVTQIAVSGVVNVALKSEGTVVVWGGTNGQNIVPAAAQGAIKVFAAPNHCAALKADGTIVQWGLTDSVGGSDLSGQTVGEYQAGQTWSAFLPQVTMEFSAASTAGLPLTGTVVLPEAAGVGGTDVSLFSNDVDAAIPGTVHVNEGSRSATFTLNPGTVTTSKVVYCSAVYGGYTSYAAVTLSPNPNCLGSLSISPNEVVGGYNGAIGTVSLRGVATSNVTINLFSDNSSRAWVPSSVVVPAGQSSATFPISTLVDITDVGFSIAASDGSNSAVAPFVSHASQIASLTLSPSSVVSGNGATATVVMDYAYPAARTVTLANNGGTTISMPTSVVIPANALQASFTISTTALVDSNNVQIYATIAGGTLATTLQIRGLGVDSLTLTPNPVQEGDPATGTVTLSAAISTDTVLNLTSSSARVGVPSTVTIPANALQATFPVTTSTVGADYSAVIKASTAGAESKSTTLQVKTLVATGISVPGPLYGIQQGTGTVTISGHAPAGFSLLLTSTKADLSVPATVSFATGASTATFTYTTGDPAVLTTATLTATVGSKSTTAKVTINPNLVKSVVVSPAKVVGGSSTPVTATVTLSGAPYHAVSIALSTDDEDGPTTVPATVTIEAGATTASFPVTHRPVMVVTPTLVTATRLNVTKSASLTLTSVALSGMTISPKSVVGGSSTPVTGTVSLTAPALTNTTVTLVSSSSAATVPANVTIVAGSKSATFPITTSYVPNDKAVLITAMADGHSVVGSLVITQNKVVSLRLSPTQVVGGSTTDVTGTVTLTAAVNADTSVALASNDSSAASVPATVFVPAGQKAGTFTVDHHDVAATHSVTITASKPNTSATATLTVTPNPIIGHSISPSTVVGGSATAVTGTVTLKASVRIATMVQLSITSGTGASVPASVSIPAGSNTGTYTITHSTVKSAKSVVIAASRNGLTKSATLRVTP